MKAFLNILGDLQDNEYLILENIHNRQLRFELKRMVNGVILTETHNVSLEEIVHGPMIDATVKSLLDTMRNKLNAAERKLKL